jgi:cytochrome c oxidase cbb3-type subunit 3
LKPAEIEATAEYVLSLQGTGVANPQGAALFAQHCASCHGADGKGNREMGAPNLTDKIALYGNSKTAIMQQMQNPRMGVMTTWKTRLPDSVIKQLTVYVHGLGGGEADKPAE